MGRQVLIISPEIDLHLDTWISALKEKYLVLAEQ